MKRGVGERSEVIGRVHYLPFGWTHDWRVRALLPFLLAPALVACGRTESPGAAAGAVAADARQADREEATAGEVLRRAAEARGKASAKLMLDRHDAAEEKRAAEQ
jgi:hypothetical protein